jgi:hypothetical protein
MADPFTGLSTRILAAWLIFAIFALITADTLSKIISLC